MPAILISATAAFMLLAGCSGGASATSPPAATSAALAETSGFANGSGQVLPRGTTFAISNERDVVVDCYNSAGFRTARLPQAVGAPGGLASDRAGNLYVADSVASGLDSVIAVYSGGCVGKPRVFSDPFVKPLGIAVDTSGNIAVVNSGNCFPGQADGIVAFFDADGNVTNTVSNSQIPCLTFGAFDAAGNLFVTGIDAISNGHGVIGEIARGAKGTSIQVLGVRPTVTRFVGIQIGRNGNISVVGPHSIIYRYAPPVDGDLGAPISVTRLKVIRLAAAFAFTDGNGSIWAPDGEPTNTAAFKFAFPKGGVPIGETQDKGGTYESLGVTAIPGL